MKAYLKNVQLPGQTVNPLFAYLGVVVEEISGQRVVLRANTDYYDGPPRAPQLLLEVLRDYQTRFAALEAGRIDGVWKVSRATVCQDLALAGRHPDGHQSQLAAEGNRQLLDRPAEDVWVLRLDSVFCHEITTPTAILDLAARGKDRVFDPTRIKAVIDHVTPAKDTNSAMQGKTLREFCRCHGIEGFFDIGRNGVCHSGCSLVAAISSIEPSEDWCIVGSVIPSTMKKISTFSSRGRNQAAPCRTH